MIPLSQPFTSPEISCTPSTAMLFHHNIYTFCLHLGDEKPGGEIGVSENDIALDKGVLQAPQQTLLVAAFTLVASYRGGF